MRPDSHGREDAKLMDHMTRELDGLKMHIDRQLLAVEARLKQHVEDRLAHVEETLLQRLRPTGED